MTTINFDIPKDTVAVSGETGFTASISLGGNILFTLTLIPEPDGSLYYHIFDEADLDGKYAIDGTLPEYFDEVLG